LGTAQAASPASSGPGSSASISQASTAASNALEVRLTASGAPLSVNQSGALSDAKGRALTISRLDMLLSQFSLQRRDGSWTSAPGWRGFFRGDLTARPLSLPPLPAGDYIAARFSVGVPPQENHGDPNRLAPDDPLHPLVNGLHWGWKGGYVFLALEGHWRPDHAPAGTTGGYSYHLADDANLVTVTLPGPVRVRPGDGLCVALDASRLLKPIDISRDGDSTHSRTQDALVVALKDSLRGAFSLGCANGGAGQAAASPATAALSVTPGNAARTRPYPMTIDARLPTPSLPPDNPLTVEGVALGQRLFFDPRLSRDNSVSCASCHHPDRAFSDGGKQFSAGVGGKTTDRNAMPIFNLAWVSEFFWDGRAPLLRKQALEPIEHPHEMAETLPRVVAKLMADRGLAAQFEHALGGPIDAERIGLALEQYLLSIVSQDARFDRVMKGADTFTPLEKRGLELFLTEHDPPNGLRGADCFHCHGGSLFTSNRLTNNGLKLQPKDIGRERVTRDAADRGKFRVPSLRNVALTGPYMHDGRFQTLEQVIDHYDSGVERGATLDPNLAKHPKEGLRLSADDKAALAAFLRTLTDPAFGPAPATGQAKLNPPSRPNP